MSVYRIRFVYWVFHVLFIGFAIAGSIGLAFMVRGIPEFRFLVFFLPILFGFVFTGRIVYLMHYQITEENENEMDDDN